MNEDLYYIQNRGYCGDCLLWWRDGGHGYTVDLNKAWKVTRVEADAICRSRPLEDFPRPVKLVDAIAERHLNSENLPDGWRPNRSSPKK